MAEAFLNFYDRMDGDAANRDAQVFVGIASQAHRDVGVVGSLASPTTVPLADNTNYVEVGPKAGDVFICFAVPTANQAARNAAKIRVTQGVDRAFARPGVAFTDFHIWAA